MLVYCVRFSEEYDDGKADSDTGFAPFIPRDFIRFQIAQDSSQKLW